MPLELFAHSGESTVTGLPEVESVGEVADELFPGTRGGVKLLIVAA